MIERKIKQSLLEKIQAMSELDLTNKVVIPLLKSMGYQKVEYYGGPDEEGKDVVAWRKDDFEDLQVTTVQVKKLKPKRAASSKDNFSEIVTQLSQSVEKPIPTIDSDSLDILPTFIYFITPYDIDTKALKSRIERVRELRERNVKIISGSRLIEQIQKKLPDLARILSGPELSISALISPILNNKVLMKSLDARKYPNIREFYTDLHLDISNLYSYSFLDLEYKPQIFNFAVTIKDWERNLKEINELSSVVQIQQFQKQFNKYHSVFTEKCKLQEKLSNEINKDSKEIKELEKRLPNLKKIKVVNDNKLIHDNVIHDHFIKEQNDLDQLIKMKDTLPIDEQKKHEDKIIESKKRIEELKKVINVIKKIDKLKLNVQQNQKKIERIRINVELDGRPLAESLENCKNRFLNEIRELNSIQPTNIEKLRLFTKNFGLVLNVTNKVLDENIILDILGINRNIVINQSNKIGRMQLSIFSFFKTNLNFILIGDAGAGKTTTLQNYAIKLIEDGLGGVLYVPLARIMNLTDSTHYKNKMDKLSDNILQNITFFLNSLGSSITYEEFIKVINDSDTILMLDGIDEVYSNYPWITTAIEEIGNQFPRVQVITSSRSLSFDLKLNNFYLLSLLPFTDKQRSYFLNSWFKNKNDKYKFIETHLQNNPALSEIITNPLLATILCTLHEQDICLPENEVELYQERMNLFVGEYDRNKGVNRLKSRKVELIFAARKLAFKLHYKNRREAKRNELIHWLKEFKTMSETYILVDELTKPCEILISTDLSGQLSFGHLRFQEYLAAAELFKNRDINLLALIDDPWWRGVFVLFSQLNESIDWFVKPFIKPYNTKNTIDTLLAMVSVRPEEENSRLSAEIKSNIFLK